MLWKPRIKLQLPGTCCTDTKSSWILAPVTANRRLERGTLLPLNFHKITFHVHTYIPAKTEKRKNMIILFFSKSCLFTNPGMHIIQQTCSAKVHVGVHAFVHAHHAESIIHAHKICIPSTQKTDSGLIRARRGRKYMEILCNVCSLKSEY